MKNCELRRWEWVQVLVWVLFMATLMLAVGILLIEGVTRSFLCFFTAAAVFIWTAVHSKRVCEKKCAAVGCRDRYGYHVRYNCVGKCHHWCPSKTDADLEPLTAEEQSEEDCCSECIFTHSAFSSSSYTSHCGCPCHPDQSKKRQKPKFRCDCHLWCWSRSK